MLFMGNNKVLGSFGEYVVGKAYLGDVLVYVSSISKMFNTNQFIFYPDGNHLRKYSILGNYVQEGTPSLTNTVPVEDITERTNNMFNQANVIRNKSVDENTGAFVDNGTRAVSNYIEVTSGKRYFISATGQLYVHMYDSNKNYIGKYLRSESQQIPSNVKYIAFDISGAMFDDDDNLTIMMSEGSSMSYEPYGYVLKLSVNGGNALKFNGAKQYTSAGLTYTIASDNKVTISGTYDGTSNTVTLQNLNIEVPNIVLGKYNVTLIRESGNTAINLITDNNKVITETSTTSLLRTDKVTKLSLPNITQGTVVNDSFYIMLTHELVDEDVEYLEYEDYQDVNIYVDKPIGKGCTIDYPNMTMTSTYTELTLTGDENWTEEQILTRKFFMISVPNYEQDTHKSLISIYSNNFKQVDRVNFTDNDFMALSGTNNWDGTIAFYMNGITSIDGVKSMLKQRYESGNPVKIYYPIQTPEIDTIDLPQIPTINNTTLIDIKSNTQISYIDITYRYYINDNYLATADGYYLVTQDGYYIVTKYN